MRFEGLPYIQISVLRINIRKTVEEFAKQSIKNINCRFQLISVSYKMNHTLIT